MHTILIAALAFAGMVGISAARADEMTNHASQQNGYGAAYNDTQATNSQDADTTAPDSVRDHGHP